MTAQKKDIGLAKVNGPHMHLGEDGTNHRIVILNSTRDTVIEDIYNHIGSKQAHFRPLELALSWILKGTFEKRHKEIWADANNLVAENMVPNEAYILRSHVVCKIKQDVDGSKFLKARICPHENKDRLKDDVRKESTNPPIASIRLTLA